MLGVQGSDERGEGNPTKAGPIPANRQHQLVVVFLEADQWTQNL